MMDRFNPEEPHSSPMIAQAEPESPGSSVSSPPSVVTPATPEGDLLNNRDTTGKVIPLDPEDPRYRSLLTQLQGNILKGHGRDFTYQLFLGFRSDLSLEGLREAVSYLARDYVTPMTRQLQEREDFKRFGVPGGLFGNLFLTSSGYKALGFSAEEVGANLPEEKETGSLETLSNFREGLHQHAVEDLDDPPFEQWQKEYRTPGAIHAMILIADDDRGFLNRQARILLDRVRSFSTVIAIEKGVALRTEAGEGIEHFGYVDGRSQPVYLQTGAPGDPPDAQDEDRGATTVWNPFEPLSRVLVPDGFAGGKAAHAYGSYFVFRKLEQDVRGFKTRELEMADKLGLVGTDRERAGAMAVGRFEDGTPLTLSPTDGFLPVKENNFTYAGDPKGEKCPFAAHIRKTNPRGDIQRQFSLPGTSNPQLDEGITERPRRITRRGITFGERERHPEEEQPIELLPTKSLGDDHSKSVGLLFMCFQSSISKQFAFMQRRWANARGFVNPAGIGLDPVIAQDRTGAPGGQTWRPDYGAVSAPRPDVPFDFSGFVAMKGGEFFFAPSVSFFSSLSTLAP